MTPLHESTIVDVIEISGGILAVSGLPIIHLELGGLTAADDARHAHAFVLTPQRAIELADEIRDAAVATATRVASERRAATN